VALKGPTRVHTLDRARLRHRGAGAARTEFQDSQRSPMPLVTLPTLLLLCTRPSSTESGEPLWCPEMSTPPCICPPCSAPWPSAPAANAGRNLMIGAVRASW
jgi:hypothetical protein